MVQLAIGVATLLVLIGAIHWSTNLLVPSPCSWWRYDRRTTVAFSLFGAALAILVTASLLDCRYLCHRWLSSGPDIIAAFAAFLMGMILERGIDPETLSLGDWGRLVLGLIIVLGFTFALVHFLQPDPVWHKFPIFIAAFALPILGIYGKRLWSQILRLEQSDLEMRCREWAQRAPRTRVSRIRTGEGSTQSTPRRQRADGSA